MFSPDVILCGWLGSKHQLNNELTCSSSLNCAKLHEACASLLLFLTTVLYFSWFSNASIRLIKAKCESFIDFVNSDICDAKLCDAISAELSSDLGALRFVLIPSPYSIFYNFFNFFHLLVLQCVWIRHLPWFYLGGRTSCRNERLKRQTLRFRYRQIRWNSEWRIFSH